MRVRFRVAGDPDVVVRAEREDAAMYAGSGAVDPVPVQTVD